MTKEGINESWTDFKTKYKLKEKTLLEHHGT